MIAEQLHTRLLENMTTAVLLLDDELRLSHINSAAENLLGLSGHRHIDTRIDSFLVDADDMVRILTETLQSGQPHTQREAILTTLRGTETIKSTIDYTATPIDDIPGSALIVEIQPIDRFLRINRDASMFSAQESNDALLRGLAHEVKNPLGGLRGAAQLLEHELVDPELKEYTKIIIDESDRLRNLVDRMLAPSQSNKPALLNIHQVIERVRQLILAESGNRVAIYRDYDPSIPDLLGDEDSLIQVFLNIVRNAVQALTQVNYDHLFIDSRRQIHIVTRIIRHFTIGREHHKLVCRIDIADNGPGIPDDIREQIFVPMVSGHAENSGLGLAIAQSIVNKHQGLINCTSEPGNTCFSVYLPLDASH